MTDQAPRIEFGAGSRTVRRGTVLDGIVRMSRDHLEGATLTIGWETEGKGTQDSAEVARLKLDRLEVCPDSSGWQKVAFSVRIPVWPVTYHGVAVKIHWRVKLHVPAHGWVGRTYTEEFQVVL